MIAHHVFQDFQSLYQNLFSLQRVKLAGDIKNPAETVSGPYQLPVKLVLDLADFDIDLLQEFIFFLNEIVLFILGFDVVFSLVPYVPGYGSRSYINNEGQPVCHVIN